VCGGVEEGLFEGIPQRNSPWNSNGESSPGAAARTCVSPRRAAAARVLPTCAAAHRRGRLRNRLAQFNTGFHMGPWNPSTRDFSGALGIKSGFRQEARGERTGALRHSGHGAIVQQRLHVRLGRVQPALQ
jgi:hypothetical protein